MTTPDTKGRGTALNGARVLITGGTRGIGRLLAAGAVERGAEVTVWARNNELGAQVADELGVRFIPVDVSDAGAVAEAARETGPIDVLVNNAGVIAGKSFVDLTEDDIRRTYEINALAPYWTTRAFLPGMIERNRGLVVNLASAAGLIGTTRMSDYSATKHAMVGFTEALRAELRAQRSAVRTLVVCPFYISTGMFDGVQTRFPWLLPILKPEGVATRTLDAIERGAAKLVLPWSVNLLPVARVLPVPVFDGVVDLLGVNHTMDRFTGRHE